ncbi:MAG: hypothetical protein DLM50_01055 [Candidatus Meridianibacter frigidus]|nr:MAG: hypothetical protein DLM50_01055 [Candidatus Eremiobacteraeota bacterium]
MPQSLGAHSSQLARVRELLTKEGRGAQQRFLVEGPTMLCEAAESGAPPIEIYATSEAYAATGVIRELESRGIPAFLIGQPTMKRLSDVKTPTGVLGICEARIHVLEDFFHRDGLVLVLADISDPGNAGTLLRSADAFGVDRVLFGAGGVEPFNPKVVRASMGSLFRVDIGVGKADDLFQRFEGWTFMGLTPEGLPLSHAADSPRRALVVGQERRGLGAWERLCGQKIAIPMSGQAESLNAAVAGSIALYELSGRARQGA